MNLIPEIAKLLNIEIGEEFKLFDTTNHDYGVFRLGENHIEQKSKDGKWSLSCEFILGAIVRGRLKVVKQNESILTEKEKEYLAAVIKPFRDRVEYVRKYAHIDNKHEWIEIVFTNIFMCFPFFEKGTMYKGMELDREYELEDLDL